MAVITTKSGLALKVYAETLASFERKNIFMELITKQTIQSGKSAQFIINGRGAENDINATTFTVSYIANIASGTVGGDYSTTLTYAATANF